MVFLFVLARQILISRVVALVAQGFAIPHGIEKRDSPGFVALDFSVDRSSIPSSGFVGKVAEGGKEENSLDAVVGKRAGTVSVNIHNTRFTYTSIVSVGSNKQKQTLVIDTGSSDLWVVDANAQCENHSYCKTSGTFNPKTSTTYQSLGLPFEIYYGDGSESFGIWGTDTIGIGAISLQKQRFADVNSTSEQSGTLGIGLVRGESGANYSNLPASLKEQGYIKTNAYSLYMNSPDALNGAIIFGGVDNAKYTGNLIPEKITRPDRLSINVTSINYNGTLYKLTEDAALDTGSPITYLSAPVVAEIAKQAGATWQGSKTEGQYVIPCDADTTGNVDFGFENAAKITVPLSEFVVGGLVCPFGFQPSPVSVSILGDNFLRHAYVVFNLDANTISLAPINYTDDSNVSAI